MNPIRLQIDALSEKLREAKKLHGINDPKTLELLDEMKHLQSQAKNKPVTNESNIKIPQTAHDLFTSRVQQLSVMNLNDSYPHKFNVDMTISTFKKTYENLLTENNQRLEGSVNSIAGRIISHRKSGQHLHFMTIQSDGDTIQVLSNSKHYRGDFIKDFANVNRFDIIGVVGVPSRSNTGEMSIEPFKLIVLSHCLHAPPNTNKSEHIATLTNPEQRYRNRHIDFINNPSNREIIVKRSKIIAFIRSYLDSHDFVEVETPILNTIPGGANARPFITHHNELNMQMFLRIAPELYLKQLVAGGFNRVYEIGRQFRNEGIDSTHDPQFTSIESYWAYKDYYDMMHMTEEILFKLSIHLYGTTDVPYSPKGSEKMHTVFNFAPPYKKLFIIPELEKRLNVSFDGMDFNDDTFNTFLRKLCKKNSVPCLSPYTTCRLFDALISTYLEPECTQPTFICDHPRVMSPLTKYHRNDHRLTERFELFVNGKELCNSYTELNNPIIQREAFKSQLNDKNNGDDEAMSIDETFMNALEYGLPPTAGWGLGIDRLVMFMTSQSSIKEVLCFPTMKPENHESTKSESKLNGQGVPRLFNF
jgi:lysyl-tRNA synthetase, class II